MPRDEAFWRLQRRGTGSYFHTRKQRVFSQESEQEVIVAAYLEQTKGKSPAIPAQAPAPPTSNHCRSCWG